MSLLRSVREKSENIKIQNVIQNYTLMLLWNFVRCYHNLDIILPVRK